MRPFSQAPAPNMHWILNGHGLDYMGHSFHRREYDLSEIKVLATIIGGEIAYGSLNP